MEVRYLFLSQQKLRLLKHQQNNDVHIYILYRREGCKTSCFVLIRMMQKILKPQLLAKIFFKPVREGLAASHWIELERIWWIPAMLPSYNMLQLSSNKLQCVNLGSLNEVFQANGTFYQKSEGTFCSSLFGFTFWDPFSFKNSNVFVQQNLFLFAKNAV